MLLKKNKMLRTIFRKKKKKAQEVNLPSVPIKKPTKQFDAVEIESEIDEFLYESNAIEGEYSQKAFNDAKIAWDYAFRNMGAFTFHYILEIHKLLARNLRPDIAGRLRACDVWIGGERKPFITKLDLEDKVKIFVLDLNRYLREFDDGKIADFKECQMEEAAKRFHVYFEQIHPFQDFNGRTGRILMQIHRLRMDLSIKIIKEKDRHIYYGWFSN